MKTKKMALVFLMAWSVSACGNDDGENTEKSNSVTDMSATAGRDTGQTAGADMGQTAGTDMKRGEDLAASPDFGTSGQVDMAMAGDVPVSAGALYEFLKADRYKTFAAEAAIQPSTGPHGRVRTYVNDTLLASLQASNTTHPVGSAAVKELYGPGDDVLKGWAVEVKVSQDKGNGSDWYWWYEPSNTNGTMPASEGLGLGGCTGCHGGGTDFVLSAGPFTK